MTRRRHSAYSHQHTTAYLPSFATDLFKTQNSDPATKTLPTNQQYAQPQWPQPLNNLNQSQAAFAQSFQPQWLQPLNHLNQSQVAFEKAFQPAHNPLQPCVPTFSQPSRSAEPIQPRHHLEILPSAQDALAMSGVEAQDPADDVAVSSSGPPPLPKEPIRYVEWPLVSDPRSKPRSPSSVTSDYVSGEILEIAETPRADALRAEFWTRHYKLCELYEAWKLDHDDFADIFDAFEADNQNPQLQRRTSLAMGTLKNRQQDWTKGKAEYLSWIAANPALAIILRCIKEEMGRNQKLKQFAQKEENASSSEEKRQLSQERKADHRALWNIRIKAQKDAEAAIRRCSEGIAGQHSLGQEESRDGENQSITTEAVEAGLEFVAEYTYGDQHQAATNNNLVQTNAANAQQAES